MNVSLAAARRLLALEGARVGLEAGYIRFVIRCPGKRPTAITDDVMRALIGAGDLDVVTEFPVREYALSKAGRARLA